MPNSVYTQTARLVSFTLLVLLFTISKGWAQTSLPQITDSTDTNQTTANNQTSFQESLDTIIHTLEDQSERLALITQLRALQLEAQQQTTTSQHQGLLGALADTIADIDDQAHAEDSPADMWRQQLRLSQADLTALVDKTNTVSALAQFIASSGLLIIALLLTNQLGRFRERFTLKRRPRISEYHKRLARFAYAIGQIIIWVGFIELSFQLWGVSLLGIGQSGLADARIGQALINLALTVLAAGLVWIMADTGIQCVLASSERLQGRDTNQARAQTITPMIRNVIYVAIVIIAAIVALANLGVNVTPLLAGVIGLAVGLTLVQDLITGIFIVIEDSLAIDNFEEINGHMGTVEGLTLRTVRLRDLDGILHIITFSHIASIHNMSRQFGVALMRIRVPHDMKIDQAIELMEETATDLRDDPTIRDFIWSTLGMQGVDRFDEGGAILRMQLRTAPAMQWDVARAFNLRLKQRMEERGLD